MIAVNLNDSINTLLSFCKAYFIALLFDNFCEWMTEKTIENIELMQARGVTATTLINGKNPIKALLFLKIYFFFSRWINFS